MIGEWAFSLSLSSSKLLVFLQHMVFSIQGDERCVSVYRLFWLYQQSYVLCCSAWINFSTCCLFQNWRNWVDTCSSCIIGVVLYLVALKSSAGYIHMTLKSSELLVSSKSCQQQSCPYSQGLACRTLLEQNLSPRESVQVLTLDSVQVCRSGSEKHCSY